MSEIDLKALADLRASFQRHSEDMAQAWIEHWDPNPVAEVKAEMVEAGSAWLRAVHAAWPAIDAALASAAYDSRPDTLIHSQRVGELMVQVGKELLDRSTCHDRSKTLPPEVGTFNEFTPRLKTSTYGSDDYKSFLLAMGAGLAHHYEHNRHHPEHFPNGVNDMTLVDLVEMLADWKAATERHDDGDLAKSLDIQRDRFSLSDQLVKILRNTAERYGWLP